jgi:regulator of cell morphogenesis and NO signaling
MSYLTLGQLLVDRPGRLDVFERFKINCFCNGRAPLGRACAEAGVDSAEVSAALAGVGAANDAKSLHAALEKVIRHLDEMHHVPMRREMDRVKGLLGRAVKRQGKQFPQWASVLAAYSEWAEHMDEHMKEEEDGVFTMCRAIIAGRRSDVKPGALAEQVRAMLEEHGEGGNETEELRSSVHDYAVPDGACDEYREAMAGLRDLEDDLHRHMYEENLILFPMALAAQ